MGPSPLPNRGRQRVDLVLGRDGERRLIPDVSRRWRIAAAVGWTLIIFVALWGPPPSGPPLFEHDDKVIHCLGFFGLGFAWSWVGVDWRRSAVIVVAIAALTELGQEALPWPRTPDHVDFLFDVLGGALGLLAAHRWTRAPSE